MVERHTLGTNGATPQSPRAGGQLKRLKRKGTFEKGHKRARGRPIGSANRLPAAVKEAIRMGAELVGDHSGRNTKAHPKGELRGVGGAELYFAELARNHKELYVELVKATLPKVIEMPEGMAPTLVYAIPPQALARMTAEQTKVYEDILKIVQGAIPQQNLITYNDDGEFAKEIDYEEVDTKDEDD